MGGCVIMFRANLKTMGLAKIVIFASPET